ncbi:MAG: Gfo/Idh/MocA family oxidoreductase [Leptospirales bacterium]|nr:Gfo/Idh/MocA family oxidoreductase [Leptospirales bacterium]
MTEKLKGGVVGLGKMGLLHAAIINSLDDTRLACLTEASSIIRNTAQSLNEKVHFYKDFSEMLDQGKPDFVFIATPPSSHIELALQCAKRGIPFFVEKPLAMSADEIEPLLNALRDRPVPNMVGFMLRYLAPFSELNKFLKTDSESAGVPLYFNATTYVSQMFRKGKGWRFNRGESGGGVLMAQAIHAVDLIVWYFGMPDTVAAVGASPYSGTVEDFGHIVFTWKSGLQGWLDSSWSVDNHRLLETRISVTTTTGTYAADDDVFSSFQRPIEYGDSGTIRLKTKSEMFSGVPVDIGGTHYTAQDMDFIESIRAGRSPESDVRNAYHVQQIMDSIYYSMSHNGEPVGIGNLKKSLGFWKSLGKLLRGGRFES